MALAIDPEDNDAVSKRLDVLAQLVAETLCEVSVGHSRFKARDVNFDARIDYYLGKIER